jgi:hypothetical protein
MLSEPSALMGKTGLEIMEVEKIRAGKGGMLMGSCPWFYKQSNLASFKTEVLHHGVGEISGPG